MGAPSEKYNKDIPDTNHKNRIAVHTHLIGLGLDENRIHKENSGWVGQYKARKAVFAISKLAASGSFTGKCLLLAGPSGTGKSALALGLAKQLGSNVPFSHINASEVYSSEVKKTEILAEAFRRAIAVTLTETKTVYCGAITKLDYQRRANPALGCNVSVSSITMELRSETGTATVRLDPRMLTSIEEQSIRVDDVVTIDNNTGIIKKMGRCSEASSKSNDIELGQIVPLPKGSVKKSETVTETITLHELDVSNSRPATSDTLSSIVAQFGRHKKTEITDRLRAEVDKIVQKYIAEDQATFKSGVLFIDEAHMLDAECFAYINRAIEQPFAPIIVLATNRGMSKIRGTDIASPHGLPADLLDRCIITMTETYSREEMAKIITNRAKIESISLDEAAIDLLADLAVQYTLRYALQLMAPAQLYAEADATEASSNVSIDRESIEMVKNLFHSYKESKDWIKENNM